MSFCPTKDIHSVYLDNELPEIYKAEYELHLKNCPACQKELEKIKSLRNLYAADSESINPDSHFLDESFERLQIKMAYNRNIGKARKPDRIVYKYAAVAVSAAVAAFAFIMPVKMTDSKVADKTTGTVAIGPAVSNSATTIVSANNSTITGNNVSFDSGRSVVVSGNIHDKVLSSEAKRKRQTDFTKNIKDVEVLRPELEDEAISIRITVPGVGDIPFVTEVNVPLGVMTGRY